MKQKILNNSKYIIIGMILAGCITLAYADNWTAPAASAPGSNLDVPIHTGPTQVKDGGLAVGPFAVFQDGLFAQQTYFDGALKGGSPDITGPTTVNIGGTDLAGKLHSETMTVAGDVDTAGDIADATVANNNSTQLCAAADGTITLCNTVAGTSSRATIKLALIEDNSYGDAGLPVIGLSLSQIVGTQITAIITMQAPGGSTSSGTGSSSGTTTPPKGGVTNAISEYIKKFYTADASAAGGCNITSTTPQVLGTLNIDAFNTNSISESGAFDYNYLNVPANCPNLIYKIQSFSPQTDPATGDSIVSVSS